MPNRVIKDLIWSSPTLARLSEVADDNFSKWLLLQDDWGCFNSDADVIKGTVYPKRNEKTTERIQEIKREYYQHGLLFLWRDGEREWGYFVSHDSHNSYCNKTNADNKGKNQKHRRKTPEPPQDLLKNYLDGDRSFFEHLGTSSDTLGQVCTPSDIFHTFSEEEHGPKTEICQKTDDFQKTNEDLTPPKINEELQEDTEPLDTLGHLGTSLNKILYPNPYPRNILFPSEKGVHGCTPLREKNDSYKIQEVDPSTPGDEKPTGASNPREVKPIGSTYPDVGAQTGTSTSGDVKPTDASNPREPKPIGTSTPSEVKPIGSSNRNDVKPPGNRDGPSKKGKSHPRLEVFREEYELAFGLEYIVGNYREEGGAAKLTEAKILSDDVFRKAVKAYLACDEKTIREKFYPFLLFIRELNRWAKKGEEAIGGDKFDKYADIYE